MINLFFINKLGFGTGRFSRQICRSADNSVKVAVGIPRIHYGCFSVFFRLRLTSSLGMV